MVEPFSKAQLIPALIGGTATLLTTVSVGFYGIIGTVGYYMILVGFEPKSFSFQQLCMYCATGFAVAIAIHHPVEAMLGVHYPGGLVFSCLFMGETLKRLRNKLVKKI